MCSHWQSEYDTSECWECVDQHKYEAKVDALYRAVTLVAKSSWGGDDCRVVLKEALEAFNLEQA